MQLLVVSANGMLSRNDYDYKEITEFIKKIRDNNELSARVMHPTDWDGYVEAACYVTPREICWFPWKNRYNCSHIEEFPGFSIESAVEGCTYYYPEDGDVCYQLSSKNIRDLLRITNTDGYKFWDKDKNIKAEYAIAGEKFETEQKIYWLAKNLLMSLLKIKNHLYGF